MRAIARSATRYSAPDDATIAIRKLAGAVILQAVKDYRREGLSATAHPVERDLIQADAKRFLKNKEEMRVWGRLAGVDAAKIAKRVLGKNYN